MADLKVYVQGLREFQGALRATNSQFPIKLREANLKGAAIVAEEARGRAPVLTGRLRGSIRPLATQTRAQVAVGGARVPYALLTEFGWPSRGMSPRPFLYPAVEASTDRLVETYGDAIDDLVRYAFPGGGL